MAAVFHNFPLLVADESLGILVEVNSQTFYMVTGMGEAEISAILLKVQDPRDNLSDLFDDALPILEMPLGVRATMPLHHLQIALNLGR